MGAPMLKGIRNSLRLFLVFCFTDASVTNVRIKAEERKEVLGFDKDLRVDSKATENLDIFSPKMDYDEWTPLGQGDPLKNDPTYDYVPPVLDRVHYWVDPEKRTPDPPLPNSSLLFFASDKESHTTSSKSPHSQYGVHHHLNEANSRFDTSSSLYPFLKFLATAGESGDNAGSGSHNFRKPSPSKSQHTHMHNKSPMHKPPQALQRPPHTMLMPPPLPTATIQKMGSSVATTIPPNFETKNQTTNEVLQDLLPPSSSPTTTAAATATTTTNDPVAIADTENVFRPVAILMPDQIKTNDKKTKISQMDDRPTKQTVKEKNEAFTLVSAKTQFPLNVPKIKEQATEIYLNKSTSVPSRSKEINKIFVDFNFRTASKPDVTQKKSNVNGDLFLKSAAPITTATTIKPSMISAPQQYKQSAKSPFYLIIEGHSKVKSYGAGKNPINQFITSNAIGCEDKTQEKRNQLKRN